MNGPPISLQDAWDLLSFVQAAASMEHRLFDAGARRDDLDAWCATVGTRTAWEGRPVGRSREAQLGVLPSYLFVFIKADVADTLTLRDAIAWCCALIPDPFLGDKFNHDRPTRDRIVSLARSYDGIPDGPAYLAAGISPTEASGTDPATARTLAALRGVTLPAGLTERIPTP